MSLFLQLCLSSVDKKLRFRELSLVKKELQFFLDKKVPQVKFVDRTFNCRHDHAMEIWQYIYDHDNGITNFHFEVSADLIREETEAMSRMRPGLFSLKLECSPQIQKRSGQSREP